MKIEAWIRLNRVQEVNSYVLMSYSPSLCFCGAKRSEKRRQQLRLKQADSCYADRRQVPRCVVYQKLPLRPFRGVGAHTRWHTRTA
jgi:hypothetical protein